MTNQQVVPEALRQADWVESVVGGPHAKQCATELLRLHAENETLRVERERNLNSIRVCNEIINKKNAELESLTTGYAAARLEIESLQARIKTMAEEHADELTVAHLDGRMRAAQPAGEYPALPSNAFNIDPGSGGNIRGYSADQMRAYVEADRAARATADSALEDAARLDWLLLHISGAEFRRIGVHYSGNASRADVDAARKQGANHD